MKLPVTVRPHSNVRGFINIVDANSRIVCTFPDHPASCKVAEAVVRKLNRDGWLGRQPYEYTREDWLFDRGSHAKTS